ncbi:MAG TPA: mannose-1-phosphate guanylyltransferase/mannose-6-phosphate isomerase [Geobacterales bacterium]|nr:mannose-1-phosphate guanylyltransferase/mannose-6-phosphate isomerase [Geobacterales bacterium]
MLTPVILSGGSGTRLWPLSRELYPKQLLSLVNEKTMLQNTVLRLLGLPGLSAPIAVCNDQHRFMVAEQLREIEVTNATIILEPVGRNTAPAVAIAALHAMAGGHDPVLFILPADHVIEDAEALKKAAVTGLRFAEAGKLITFGILPTGPETGYGYIKAGEGMEGGAKVERFVEKPDRSTAEGFLAAGGYFWNSGMFMFKASRFLAELEKFAPAMLAACRIACDKSEKDLDFVRLDHDAFAACASDSIDYAVMEKTADSVVIPLDAGWNDVGSWSSLWQIGTKDAAGNVVVGDVFISQVNNCYLHAEGRLLAAVGIDDLVVVETADAVLVAHKEKVQNVKEIVATLKAKERPEASTHCKVQRPWGCYESIDGADRFQVKRITVRPGAALSLQMHHHRAEHWIVVSGTALISRGDEQFTLSENQSTYIPLGVTHRLENPGKIPLELIEVQSGSYLGEDDIVRFEDVYGR